MIETAEIISIAASFVLTVMLLYVSFALRSFKESVKRLESAVTSVCENVVNQGKDVVRLETQIEHLTTTVDREIEIREAG